MQSSQDLRFQAHVSVTSIWRDDDGYGNVDDDVWILDLQVSGWENTKLKARYEQELQVGTKYNVTGTLYIDPGKEWTSTYLRIHTIQQNDNPQSDPPTFEILAPVASVTETHITLVWQTFDDYERALYGQSAKLKLENPLPQAPNLVNTYRHVSGVMNGLQQEHWICKQITL